MQPLKPIVPGAFTRGVNTCPASGTNPQVFRVQPLKVRQGHDETVKLLRLMDLEGDVRVEDGATHAIPADSAGAPKKPWRTTTGRSWAGRTLPADP